MQYLVSSDEMKAFDKYTIESVGIPALVLMERAACATTEEICRRFPAGAAGADCVGRRVLVLAGCGNNGGDGLAIGRILREHGFAVEYVLAGPREKCSRETLTQLAILEHMGVHVSGTLPEGSFDLIVDALFGVGLSRAVSGFYGELIRYINAASAFVVSADIPSGIHADTGAVMGEAVRADLTVTYGCIKRGLVLYPGASHTGELICRKIGIVPAWKPSAYTLEPSDLTKLPFRRPDGNKGTFGKVLVVAGNERMYGACQFAALGAYRMGAGLVRVLTAPENRNILMQAVPEAIVDICGEEFSKPLFAEALAWADCVVIGPGLGTDGRACRIVEYVWEHAQVPLVVDADGLNILAAHPDLLEGKRPKGERMVYFTPHMGEFSRLAKKSIKCCKEEMISAVMSYAQEQRVILVCKDARTVAADQTGAVYINTSGDNGMATGGSGDVLAGILAGLLAQGMHGMEAAAMAVYLHGLAGNRASARKSAYAVMAGDLLEALPTILTEGGDGRWV